MKRPKAPVKTEERGFFNILYDLFGSLKLTVFLLLLLAIISIIGTLISQNATATEYTGRYGPNLYQILNFFNLFDLFHSWWFKTILSLMALNLIVCSLQRLPAIWRQISPESSSRGLEDSILKSLPFVEKIQNPNWENKENEEIIRILMARWFGKPRGIETEKSVTLFSEKGKYSRLGVYLTHLSFLIILTGGLIGSQYGFRGFVNILEGETVHQIFLGTKAEEIPKPLGFSVRCDAFNITYYDLKGPEKRVKEYTSFLTILEDGKEVLKKTVQVNHPLKYKGLAFYQANYGSVYDITLGIQWKNDKAKKTFKTFEGETVPIPDSNDFIMVMKYYPHVHYGEGVQAVLFKAGQKPRVFSLLKGLPNTEESDKDEFTLTFEGASPKNYTGLQVTKDPGVWLVWIGCGLMVLGLIISFFLSHQRIWVRISGGAEEGIVIGGSANKNRVEFEKKFRQLTKEIRSAKK